MTTFDQRMQRVTGVDLRLLYGLPVPMLAATGFILAYLLTDSMWLLAPVLIFIFAAAGVVVVGIVGMLGERDND